MASVIASVTINCLLVTVSHIACCMLFVKESDISQSLHTALNQGLSKPCYNLFLFISLLFPIRIIFPLSCCFRICTFAWYVVAIVMNWPPNVEEGDKRRHKWYLSAVITNLEVVSSVSQSGVRSSRHCTGTGRYNDSSIYFHHYSSGIW